MLNERLELPEGMEFRPNPRHVQKVIPEARKGRTRWEWVARALFARPSSWARIARYQPTRSLANNINAGRIKGMDPQVIVAEAVRVQSEPSAWDIYARARLEPVLPDGREPSEQERAEHMLRIAELRREWYEVHQLEWLNLLARRNSEEEARAKAASAEAETGLEAVFHGDA